MKHHGLVFVAAALSLFAAAGVMTAGRFDLLTAGAHFSVFYDELGRSILHGRFDVPPAAIGPEALLIGGRTYGYFGPTPALLRIPLDWLFPAMWGRWTQLFLSAATAASLWAAHDIQRAARRAFAVEPRKPLVGQLVDGGFLLAVGVGTTLLFMARRPDAVSRGHFRGRGFYAGRVRRPAPLSGGTKAAPARLVGGAGDFRRAGAGQRGHGGAAVALSPRGRDGARRPFPRPQCRPSPSAVAQPICRER